MPVTIEHRKDFVENVTKLSLWLSEKYCDKGIAFEDALTKATPLYRFTTFWDDTNHQANGYNDKQWNVILTELKKLRLQKMCCAVPARDIAGARNRIVIIILSFISN